MAVTAVGAKQEPELVFKSLQKTQQRERILVLGQPEHGKTSFGLTMSKKFKPNQSGKGVLIDDIAVVTVDAAALNYARVLGYEFAYWLDLSEHLNKTVPEFNKVTEKFFAAVNQLAKEEKIHSVLFDNISTLDGFWRGELAKNFEGWPLQDKMDLEHRRFLLERVLPLSCNVILLAHCKTVGKMDDEKRTTLGLDKDERLVMAVSSWNAPQLYRAQTTMRLPIKRVSGKTVAEDKYDVYPRGVDGIESGSRYPQLLAHDKLPADMQVVFSLMNETARTA